MHAGGVMTFLNRIVPLLAVPLIAAGCAESTEEVSSNDNGSALEEGAATAARASIPDEASVVSGPARLLFIVGTTASAIKDAMPGPLKPDAIDLTKAKPSDVTLQQIERKQGAHIQCFNRPQEKNGEWVLAGGQIVRTWSCSVDLAEVMLVDPQGPSRQTFDPLFDGEIRAEKTVGQLFLHGRVSLAIRDAMRAALQPDAVNLESTPPNLLQLAQLEHKRDEHVACFNRPLIANDQYVRDPHGQIRREWACIVGLE
jgi:hypothetical protein